MLKRAELRAIGAAIRWMDLCLRHPQKGDPPSALEAERERLKLARSAYRKLNAAHKAARPKRGKAPDSRT